MFPNFEVMSSRLKSDRNNPSHLESEDKASNSLALSPLKIPRLLRGGAASKSNCKKSVPETFSLAESFA